MKIRYSLAALIFLVVAASVVQVLFVSRGEELSRGSGYLWYATYSYVVALAVEADRRSRQMSAPFEYSAFVFFAWPVLVPYYLYGVRGWRGLALGVGLVLYSSIPDFAAYVTYFLMQE